MSGAEIKRMLPLQAGALLGPMAATRMLAFLVEPMFGAFCAAMGVLTRLE